MAKASPEAASKTQETNYFSIEKMQETKNTPSHIFSGVCSSEGWKPGKMVTEKEYEAATQKFLSAPLNGGNKKC